jgi:hypothetical protein
MSPISKPQEKIQETYSKFADKLDQTFAAFENLNNDLAEISELVCSKLLAELRTGSVSAYNASCAYSNVVNATNKIQKQLLELLAAIKAADPAPDASSGRESEDQKRVRQMSEKMLALMARAQVPTDNQ